MERKSPIFSIIVTAYNVSAYLDECLNSVTRQTVEQYELIIIDDGSTDRSGEIIDLYGIKHNNVRVIHQKNQGLSVARNVGLKSAKGDYVLFLDGDDYIHSETLSMFLKFIDIVHPEIIATCKNYVVEFGKDVCVEPDTCIDEKLTAKSLSGLEYIKRTMQLNIYQACAPYYVYQRKFLEKTGIQFEKGIFHEDELWSLQLLPQALQVVVNKVPFYYHRMRSGSITHQSVFDKNARDLIYICNKLDQLFPRTLDYVWVRNHIATLYMNATYLGGDSVLKSRKLNRKFPLMNAYTMKNRIKAIIYFASPYIYVKLDLFIKNKAR